MAIIQSSTRLVRSSKEEDPWLEFHIGSETQIPEGGPTNLSHGRVKLLRRSEMTTINQVLDDGEMGFTRLALQGASGVGKSYLMLEAVHRARERGWIVLYIPQAKNLLTVSQSNIALMDILWNQIKVSMASLESIAEKDFSAMNAFLVLKHFNEHARTVDAFELFIQYLINICKINEIPVLIAIDQWNEFEKPDNSIVDHPIAKFFGSFNEFHLRRGVYLVAASSFFTKMTYSDENTQMTISVPMLTDREMEILIKELVSRYSLGIDVTVQILKFVKMATGSLIVLVCWLFELWYQQKLRGVDAPLKKAFCDFIKYTKKHFMDRMQSLLLLDPSSDQEMNIRFAASLMGGGRIAYQSEGFEAAGLCHKGGKVTCKQALAAILNVLKSRRIEALNLLTSISGSERLAREFAFWSIFHGGNKIVTVVKNALGQETGTIDLHFQRMLTQAKIPSKIDDSKNNKFDYGDLLILAKGHPTLDFVGYTMRGQLVLGQLSTEKYKGRKDIAHVFERKWDKVGCNIADFYLECVNLASIKRGEHRTPIHVTFLYVTTSRSFLTTGADGCYDPVSIVDGDALKLYFKYPQQLLDMNDS